MNFRFLTSALSVFLVFSGELVFAQNAAIDAFRAEVTARNDAIKNSNLDFYGDVELTGENEATLIVKPDWMTYVTPADSQGNLDTLFNVWQRRAGSDATFIVVDVDGNIVKRFPESADDAQATPTPQPADGLEPTDEEFVFAFGDRQLAFPAGVCQIRDNGSILLQGRVGQSGVAFQFNGNRAEATFRDVHEQDGRTLADFWVHDGDISYSATDGRLSVYGEMELISRTQSTNGGENSQVQGFEKPPNRPFAIEAQC